MYVQKIRKMEVLWFMSIVLGMEKLSDVLPSFSIAMIRTMKGGKSYSQINARRAKPSCKRVWFDKLDASLRGL